jgi:hypothetical protein
MPVTPEIPDTETTLRILAAARDRCEKEDMRTAEVFAALDYLAARAQVLWPYENFRQALNWWKPDEWQADATGRSQNVNAAFNGIARQWRKDAGAR